MIITRNWLGQWMNLKTISNDDIVNALNSLGFEVDGVHDYNRNTKLIGACIKSAERVPGSDHLNLCQVAVSATKTYQIICGASNVQPGMYVALAPLGATLANGLTMTKREIKGYTSFGMMCAFDELGLNKKYLTESEQDWIINIGSSTIHDTPVLGNRKINKLMNFDDVAFDVDLTLNRSDALAGYQIAKELANYFKLRIKPLPSYSGAEMHVECHNDYQVECEVEGVRQVTGLVVKTMLNELPLSIDKHVWLKMCGYTAEAQSKAAALGAWTAFETGQPIITLCADAIRETLRLTDDYENPEFGIQKGDLVLVAGNEFVHWVGIKTNPIYEPKVDTKQVLALAISVDFELMRKQQKRVGTSNVALQRYIKPIGLAPNMTGLLRFAQLALDNHLALAISGVREYLTTPVVAPSVTCSLAAINKLLGLNLVTKNIKGLLEPLGFGVTALNNGKDLRFICPVERCDISTHADIAEEIARIYGYNNIPAQPVVLPSFEKSEQTITKQRQIIRNFLLNRGFYETKTYNLTSEKTWKEFNFFNCGTPYRVMSPLSQERAVLRSSLLESLLEVTAYNNARRIENVAVFTSDTIYAQNPETTNHHVAWTAQAVIDQNQPLHDRQMNSFFYMKGMMEALLAKMKCNPELVTYQTSETTNAICHPFQTAQVIYNGVVIGIIGKLHPVFAKQLKVKDTYFAELDLTAFNSVHTISPTFYVRPAVNNAIERDLTVVQGAHNCAEIQRIISRNVEFLTGCVLIDRYEDSNTHEVALTFKLIFNSSEMQLTDTQATQAMQTISDNLQAVNITIK